MKEKWGERGGQERELLRSYFKHPTMLYWAIISFPSRHWNSVRRIPSQFIFWFTSLRLGGKRGINLKFHVIHARIICYSMKVLFAHKSIRGNVSLVPRSPSTGAGAPGETWPCQGRVFSPLGAQDLCGAVGATGGAWPPAGTSASFWCANPLV